MRIFRNLRVIAFYKPIIKGISEIRGCSQFKFTGCFLNLGCASLCFIGNIHRCRKTTLRSNWLYRPIMAAGSFIKCKTKECCCYLYTDFIVVRLEVIASSSGIRIRILAPVYIPLLNRLSRIRCKSDFACFFFVIIIGEHFCFSRCNGKVGSVSASNRFLP